MHTARSLSKFPIKQASRIFFKPQKPITRNMSLFPRTFITAEDDTPNVSYHPLFRFFDEFDQYSRAPERANRSTSGLFPSLKTATFTPKFDVKEVKDAYELHGEFPGIDQKNIDIEFSDSNTLTIKGRTERHYSSGNPPTGFIEGEASNNQGKITEKGHDHADHHAKVEDESTATSTEVTNTNTNKENSSVKKSNGNAHKQSHEKFWVSERSVGEFSRSFTFPVAVDQDAVKASMKNGILSVVVPKAKKHEGRKISIE